MNSRYLLTIVLLVICAHTSSYSMEMPKPDLAGFPPVAEVPLNGNTDWNSEDCGYVMPERNAISQFNGDPSSCRSKRKLDYASKPCKKVRTEAQASLAPSVVEENYADELPSDCEWVSDSESEENDNPNNITE